MVAPKGLTMFGKSLSEFGKDALAQGPIEATFGLALAAMGTGINQGIIQPTIKMGGAAMRATHSITGVDPLIIGASVGGVGAGGYAIQQATRNKELERMGPTAYSEKYHSALVSQTGVSARLRTIQSANSYLADRMMRGGS